MHGAHADNDATQVNLGKQTVAACVGAHVIAPSATMDSQDQATRRVIDDAGFTQIQIIALAGI